MKHDFPDFAVVFTAFSAGLALFCLLVGACAGTNKLTAQDQADLATLTAEVAACNAVPDGGAPACKASVRAAFDAKENARFDGGFGGGK